MKISTSFIVAVKAADGVTDFRAAELTADVDLAISNLKVTLDGAEVELEPHRRRVAENEARRVFIQQEESA